MSSKHPNHADTLSDDLPVFAFKFAHNCVPLRQSNAKRHRPGRVNACMAHLIDAHAAQVRGHDSPQYTPLHFVQADACGAAWAGARERHIPFPVNANLDRHCGRKRRLRLRHTRLRGRQTRLRLGHTRLRGRQTRLRMRHTRVRGRKRRLRGRERNVVGRCAGDWRAHTCGKRHG